MGIRKIKYNNADGIPEKIFSVTCDYCNKELQYGHNRALVYGEKRKNIIKIIKSLGWIVSSKGKHPITKCRDCKKGGV